MDLHGYGHWSCQLALLAGLRSLYHKFLKPGWHWPNSDLVVRCDSDTTLPFLVNACNYDCHSGCNLKRLY